MVARDTMCQSNCNERGCVRQEEDCAFEWEASQFGSWNCYNNCSDVGVCRAGFCHCPAGRFGLDCSRTEAYAPREHRPARGDNLRIYVYDLPTSLALAETLDYGTRSPNTENFQVSVIETCSCTRRAWPLLPKLPLARLASNAIKPSAFGLPNGPCRSTQSHCHTVARHCTDVQPHLQGVRAVPAEPAAR